MSGFRIAKRGETYFIEGWITEANNLVPLLATTDPLLRINCKGITSINSIGLGGMIKFGEALAERRVEFVELSPVLVDAVNIVPLVVGGQKKVTRIKSVIAPMNCKAKHPVAMPIQIKDLIVRSGTIKLPLIKCEKCLEPMALDDQGDPEDFFFFLIASEDS